jgi:hypothetical protein
MRAARRLPLLSLVIGLVRCAVAAAAAVAPAAALPLLFMDLPDVNVTYGRVEARANAVAPLPGSTPPPVDWASCGAAYPCVTFGAFVTRERLY